jgi:hypothetical protein
MPMFQKYFRVTAIALAIVAAVTFGAARAEAANLTVSDGNSSFTVDDASAAGMHTWIVDGVDQMFQQWFWYRIGSVGGEHSIDDLSAAVSTVSEDLNVVRIVYSSGGLTIRTQYTLQGGANGSQQSDIAESITITNETGAALDFHFFQYSDFDLCGAIGGQTVTFVNANTVDQTGGGCNLSETVVTPAASHHQASGFNSLVAALEDGSPTILSDNAGFGPGDATWAFQWDVLIANGGSFQISKDKNLRAAIPEPASLFLLGSGLLGGLKTLRRRNKKNAAA